MKRITILVFATAASCLAGAQGMQMHSRYSGPAYGGAPMLKATASLIAAGGGTAHFSTAKAVVSIAGQKLTNQEIDKLTKQYGADAVSQWIAVGDFAVEDALRIATAAGVKLPKANLSGKKLGAELVNMGLAPDRTYYVELMLDKLLSHDIHTKVMDDIDAKLGQKADASYHRISNQAYFDLGKALGMKLIKLADFH